MRRIIIRRLLVGAVVCVASASVAQAANHPTYGHYSGHPTYGHYSGTTTGSSGTSTGSAATASTKDPIGAGSSSHSGGGEGDQAHDGGDSGDAGSAGNPPPASGDAIVDFRAVRTGDVVSGSQPLTLGQVFRQGDVPKGRSVRAKVAGRNIPAQVDAKAAWPDGSLRHAVITVRLPSAPAGGGTPVRLVSAGKQATSQHVTLNQLLATDFDGAVTLKARGTAYHANVRDLLQQVEQAGGCSVWGRQCKRWLSGPLVSEWIVGGPLKSASGATSHMAVYFNIRAYSDGNGNIERARVDTVVENDWAYTKNPQNTRYSIDISVGQHSYQLQHLKNYRQARWHRVLWWHRNPHLYARIDTDYLQSTGAISHYANVTPSNGFLNSVAQHFPPMSHGNQTRAMGTTGAQPAIGPLPRWTSAFVVSGDHRAFRWMLANDNAVGSYSFHYRDRATGRPLEITRHPYVTIADRSYASRAGGKYHRDLLPACHGDCHSPYTFDISHHPSIGYVPYLVTGDFYYLEEMQFTASYMELWANPKYRGYTRGILRGAQGQVRGQAWALRSISDAAFVTPDHDPMKSYFMGQVRRILSDYNRAYVDAGTSPLHVLNNYGAVIYPAHGRSRVGIAPWQQDFFTWAVGHAAQQDMPGAKPFLKWLSAFQIGRMTDWQNKPSSGYCWLEASAYSLQIRDSRHGAFYKNLEQAYHANFPRLYGTKCDSPQMINRINNQSQHRYRQGEMVGYAYSATGFPSNYQIGLAMAAESGQPKASEAWQIFAHRKVKPNYDNYPNFAVVPR